MKTNQIIDLVKTNNIVIPNSLLKNYKKLNINEKELIFLSFLMNRGEKVLFDVENFSKELNWEIIEIMGIVSSLTDKKIITLVVEKNLTVKEYLSLEELYMKLTNFLIVIEEPKSSLSNIYEVIEKEFGRTLSPIEYETIKGWLDSNLDEELIKAALKEAVLNGVNNLKYI